jgi:DNA-binding HxlR family transcriptional regulator
MALLDLTGRRWALRVMWELTEAGNPLTFRDLRDRCAQMSSSVLTRRLDELREAHLVTHDDTGYTTTPLGLDLVKRLQPLIEWSGKWAEELHQEHTTNQQRQ